MDGDDTMNWETRELLIWAFILIGLPIIFFFTIALVVAL